MKRLAVVLAAALSTAGCFHGECNRSVTVDWPGFRLADGSTTQSCTTAGVSTIDVWVNDAYAATFDCNGPAGEVGLARGDNLVTVEARDAGGVIRLRDEVSVAGSGCGNLGVVDARPAEGRVNVDYLLPNGACYSNTIPSFIWVYVRDEIANEIAADSSAAPESSNVCGVNTSLSFFLAAGNYSLLRTQEMIRAATPGTYSTVGADCTAYGFTVTPAGTAIVQPHIADANASCP